MRFLFNKTKHLFFIATFLFLPYIANAQSLNFLDSLSLRVYCSVSELVPEIVNGSRCNEIILNNNNSTNQSNQVVNDPVINRVLKDDSVTSAQSSNSTHTLTIQPEATLYI